MFIEGTISIIGGSIGWMIWRQRAALWARVRLMRCMMIGKLYVARKWGKKEVREYPQIRRVELNPLRLTFTIPNGLDPDTVKEKLFLFQQEFGQYAELSGHLKAFTLTVYEGQVKPFRYEYEAVSDRVKALKLPIYVGKNRQDYILYDMLTHPHLLVSGDTGSGKSSLLRVILTTLILSGVNVKLYCADMKRTEFHLFKNVAERVEYKRPGVLAMLTEVRNELDRRGDLLESHEVAHVDELPEPIPYLIVCIDEFALLSEDKNVMALLEDISGIGRALGCFLILSCLRPDREALTGQLKQNLTVRLTGHQPDPINYGIVLGEQGKYEIEQPGQMVLKFKGIQTVQTPYLTLPRAKKILAPYKRKTPPVEVKKAEEDIFFVL